MYSKCTQKAKRNPENPDFSRLSGIFHFIPTRQSFSNTKQICLVFYGNIQIFSLKSPYSFALFNFLVSK